MSVFGEKFEDNLLSPHYHPSRQPPPAATRTGGKLSRPKMVNFWSGIFHFKTSNILVVFLDIL